MDSFPKTLKMLMDRDPTLTQDRLSSLSGIDSASISRYMSGKRFPLVEPLARLVASISSDRDERLMLMIAYLRDIAEQCQIAGFDERHYTIEATGAPIEGFGADIELLAERARGQPSVRNMIKAMADLIRKHDENQIMKLAEEADAPLPRPPGDASTSDQIILAEVNRRAASSQRNAAS